MSYKGHIFGGIITYLIALIIINCWYPIAPIQALGWFFICLLGAIFPDIDTTSKMRALFLRLCIGVFLILAVLPSQQIMVIPLLPLIAIPLMARHRGIFHNKLFLIGVPLTIALVLISTLHSHQPALVIIPTLFFVAGSCSHLILDKRW